MFQVFFMWQSDAIALTSWWFWWKVLLKSVQGYCFYLFVDFLLNMYVLVSGTQIKMFPFYSNTNKYMAKILKFLFQTDVASDNENYIYHIDASTAGLKF